MASEKELYRKAFYKIHPEGGKVDENFPSSRKDNWKYKSVRGYSDKETARVFYTRDGVIDPFKTYSESYLSDYMDEHPLDDEVDELKAEIKRKKKKDRDDDDDEKGCCGAWYCCPFRCSWRMLCSFFG